MYEKQDKLKIHLFKLNNTGTKPKETVMQMAYLDQEVKGLEEVCAKGLLEQEKEATECVYELYNIIVKNEHKEHLLKQIRESGWSDLFDFEYLLKEPIERKTY
jgi:hypothetical protein